MRTGGAQVRVMRSIRSLAFATTIRCGPSLRPRGDGIDLDGALTDQTKAPPVGNHRACYARSAEEVRTSRTQGGGCGKSWYIRLSALVSARNQSLSQAL